MSHEEIIGWIQTATLALEMVRENHRKYEDLKEALVGDSDDFTHDELIEKIHDDANKLRGFENATYFKNLRSKA